ncbi:pentatricopeptide repeat-containing protein At3g57430, chloroplastic [Selaginella moellendorffii]|uniref:pentatricopeptide repeat-containing protein At3g57430, chloroplastic n=1 Tax=Selaginella moellendorffii TaxID=88036 RepID=UPI000D1C62DA|nr:pentatricopeptide repeat-containing protein At3g57430, chloroplastic [Selaginella moellendorffii]|eukprot:XP_024522111.1 pentatricopeptide repeat-containing protein At3g57430, chloroplastic [Selaginella moellendorffii]
MNAVTPGTLTLTADSRWRRKEMIDTYEALLKQYGNSKSLTDGRQVHSQMISNGLDGDTYLGNLLVQMYGRCGSLDDARAAFQGIHQRNVFSWTILISLLVQNGEASEGLELLKSMDLEGTEANKITFISLLGACSVTGDLSLGKTIHERIRTKGLESDIITSNALLNMYTTCESLDEARLVFERMVFRDVVSWTIIISAYAHAGYPLEALQLYRRMEQEFSRPDAVTLISVLEACASLRALVEGKAIHERIVASGVETDVFVGTAVVSFYGKCEAVEDARQVFDRILDKDIVCWNAMIGAYAQNHCEEKAFALYLEMVENQMPPNDVTLITLLDSCSSTCKMERGSSLHREAAARGYLSHTSVVNALINMYAKCGSLENATRVFIEATNRTTNVITWNTMIVANAQEDLNLEALQIYHRMNQEGIKASDVTYGTVLAVCANLGDFTTGREVHSRSLATGCCSDVVKNSLICLYGGCGNLEAAQTAFESVASKNVVSWSSIVAAYARNGEEDRARNLFWTMNQDGVLPNIVTFTSVLHACSHAGLADEGWSYFLSMQGDHHLEPTPEHYGCMVNLLAKSGRVKQAASFMSAMPVQPDASAWRSLLGACEVHTDKEYGALAAKQLLDAEPRNSAAYVLLYNISKLN